jgi:hypothetical protein
MASYLESIPAVPDCLIPLGFEVWAAEWIDNFRNCKLKVQQQISICGVTNIVARSINTNFNILYLLPFYPDSQSK